MLITRHILMRESNSRRILFVSCNNHFANHGCCLCLFWCLRQESNLRRRDFQSLALPPELQRHITRQFSRVAPRLRFSESVLGGAFFCCNCLLQDTFFSCKAFHSAHSCSFNKRSLIEPKGIKICCTYLLNLQDAFVQTSEMTKSYIGILSHVVCC